MDERALLLLGLLRSESQHGYRLNDFIDRNLCRVTDMKRPTAYYILDRLADAGLVQIRTEQEGNRPPRKVYGLTPAGEQQFLRLLRENLSQAHRTVFAGDIGLMLLDHLPRREVIDALRRRLAGVGERLRELEATPRHGGAGINLAVEHGIMHLQSEQAWLESVVERLAVEPAAAAGAGS